jgi:hypothetical protein
MERGSKRDALGPRARCAWACRWPFNGRRGSRSARTSPLPSLPTEPDRPRREIGPGPSPRTRVRAPGPRSRQGSALSEPPRGPALTPRPPGNASESGSDLTAKNSRTVPSHRSDGARAERESPTTPTSVRSSIRRRCGEKVGPADTPSRTSQARPSGANAVHRMWDRSGLPRRPCSQVHPREPSPLSFFAVGGDAGLRWATSLTPRAPDIVERGVEFAPLLPQEYPGPGFALPLSPSCRSHPGRGHGIRTPREPRRGFPSQSGAAGGTARLFSRATRNEPAPTDREPALRRPGAGRIR